MFRVTKLAPTAAMKALHAVLCLMGVAAAALAVAFASWGPAGQWVIPHGSGAFIAALAIIGALCNVLAFAVIVKPPSDTAVRLVAAACGVGALGAAVLFVRAMFGSFSTEGWLPGLLWAPIGASVFLAQLARLTDHDLPKSLRHQLNR